MMDRDKIIRANTLKNYIFKILLMLVNFAAVPITINYLGVERYGLWSIILSIISWMNISDFGIGNGLRNRIAESMANKRFDKVKEYISTAYYTLSIIAMIILTVSFLIIKILSNLYKFNNELNISLYIMVIGFSLNFILGISRYVAYGNQKSSLVGLTQLIASVLSILGIILIKKNFIGSIILLSFIYNVSLMASNLFLTFVVYKNQKVILPSLKLASRDSIKDISNLGFRFFIIQLCGIVLFSTDNLIISTFINLESVTTYNIITKVFNSISTLFSIVLIAVWSGVTHAYAKNEIQWIRSAIDKLHRMLLGLILVVSIIGVSFNTIVDVWIRQNIAFSYDLIIVFGLYTVLLGWNGIYVNIINGIGDINLQLITSVIGAVINIPLSIFLAVQMNMGIVGVKLATLLCVMISSIALPIQVNKILRYKKTIV